MPKTMLKPGPDLLQRVNQAFFDYGYSGLSMVTMARACGFTQRALYYYFNNKEAAFRAVINFRNEEAVALAREAGRAVRANGGNALDILAEILDIRYGETRRRVIASPHTAELNAEALKRCRDLMVQSAIDFQVELKELIIDLEKSRLLKLNGRFTAAEMAQALADGGRAVALPPIAGDDLRGRYRLTCEMILYGCAAMPRKRVPRRKMPKRK